MKKFLFPLLVLAMIVSSCGKVTEKPFKASECDSVTIKDGSENPVTISVHFLMDSACVLNDLIENKKEYEDFIGDIFWNLKKECKYELTFKPEHLYGLEIGETEVYNGVNMYRITTLAEGVASNGFGVPSKVSEVLHLVAWREVYTWDDGTYDVFWRVLPDDDWWMEYIKGDIDKYVARINE